MANRLYLINFFAAGGNQRGSNYSNFINSFQFDNKIDFNQIRNEFKKMALHFIDGGSVCLKETNIYTQTVVIEDNKVIGYKTLNVSLTSVLKWRTK